MFSKHSQGKKLSALTATKSGSSGGAVVDSAMLEREKMQLEKIKFKQVFYTLYIIRIIAKRVRTNDGIWEENAGNPH